MKKQLKTLLGSGMFLLATALPTQAAADKDHEPQRVNFNVEVLRQVERDTMQVVLYAQESGKTLKAISETVTQKLNLAVEEAKKRNIQTGMTNRRTYINYDKQGKPSGWTDYAEITLESQDFTALSELIAATGEQLAVQNTNFTVSQTRKLALEQALTEEVLQAFKQKAELISKNLSAKSYRVANLDISSVNESGNDQQTIYYERKAVFASSEAEPMQVQSGVADLKIQLNASIDLINE
ncbi:SIMPL domain-containing protein [Testudinibacter sp. P80/BLE/0925]|uniref:SIMPL domain-containing protein n=1 Tax=Testudinibacter sp. TW-1 TaxID=3417757 RepID=UPI003D36BB89